MGALICLTTYRQISFGVMEITHWNPLAWKFSVEGFYEIIETRDV